ARAPDALCRVDLVHRPLHVRVGIDVVHQRLHDVVAILVHRVFQAALHGVGDLVLVLENIVQLHLGDDGADLVIDERLDLHLRIRQFVVCMANAAGHDVILHRHGDLDEHVVQRLRLHVHVELMDAQADTSGNLLEGEQYVHAGRGNAGELAKALDDGGALLLNGDNPWNRQHLEPSGWLIHQSCKGRTHNPTSAEIENSTQGPENATSRLRPWARLTDGFTTEA